MKLATIGGLVAFGLVCWLGTAASAQDRGADPESIFQRLDANGDGKLVADELAGRRTEFFERLLRIGDADRDQALTKDEFVNGMQEARPADDVPFNPERRGFGPGPGRGPEGLFRMFDRDGDGTLTRKELDEVPEEPRRNLERLFEQVGKDGLTIEDFLRLGPERRFGAGEPGNPEEMFLRIDANQDGKITLAEMPEPMQRMFKPMLERTGKDELTREEFLTFAGRRFGMADRGRPDGTPNDGNPRARRRPNPPDGEANRAPEERGRRPGGEARAEARQGDRPDGDRGPNRDERRRPRDTDDRMRRDDDRRREADGRRPPFGDRPPRGPAIFARLDADSDGTISRDELAKAVDQFDRLDTDKDGTLDLREAIGLPPDGSPRGRDESADRPDMRGRRPSYGDMRRFRPSERPEWQWRGGRAPYYGGQRGFGRFGGPGGFGPPRFYAMRPPGAFGPFDGFSRGPRPPFDRMRPMGPSSRDDEPRDDRRPPSDEMRRDDRQRPDRFSRMEGSPDDRRPPFEEMRRGGRFGRDDGRPGARPRPFDGMRRGRPERPRPDDAEPPRASTQDTNTETEQAPDGTSPAELPSA